MLQVPSRGVKHTGDAGQLPALPPHLPLPAQTLHLAILSILYQVTGDLPALSQSYKRKFSVLYVLDIYCKLCY